jgi:uncharacterized membrane protein YuzA (DUF378 family)
VLLTGTEFASLSQSVKRMNIPDNNIIFKEQIMATMDSPMMERRHLNDRRSGSMVHKKRMTAAEWIPMLLLVIGGLNWGLVGLFDFNLVAALFGEGSPLARVIYVAVGLSALYSLYMSARLSSKHG